MDTRPAIGDRVKVKAWHRYHPCSGVVTAIWPTRKYDIMHPDWFDPDHDPIDLGPAHERDWIVTVEVDAIPANWDYYDQRKFQPLVFELNPA